MTEAERKSFFNHTSCRGPGKRQIKPTAAVLDLVLPAAEDEDDDEDFIAEHGSTEGSDSDESGSNDGSSCSTDGEGDDGDDERADGEPQNEDATIRASLADETLDSTPICGLCLNLSQAAKTEEVIRCDKCGLTVHDSCYPSLDVSDDSESSQSTSSMEPWFCEPCIFGFNEPPYCELCPSRYGAMKRSDVGGRWVHLVCALYTHGVTFGDIDHLSAVSWQEMDHRNFGRKSCSGCADVLEARSGVTTRCEVGLCKQYYHVTCAQRLGLLVDHSEEVHTDHSAASPGTSHRHGDHHTVEPRYINCRQHSNPDELRVKKLAAARFLAQEEKRLLMVGKNILSEREERKRIRARERYEKLFQSLVGVTICLPEAFHDKPEKKARRARHLTTSPEFFEWFQEKAEISGVEPDQFKKEFTRVSGDTIASLPPGYSWQFFEYLHHRERVLMTAEEEKLKSINESKVALKKQLDAQVTKLKLSEQNREMARVRCEQRRQLAVAFHRVLMRLGARKIAAHCPLFSESVLNGRMSNHHIKGSLALSSGTPPPRLKREVSINMCKECGKANDQHLMVGCDSCYEFYHIGCLDPPLEKVPKKVNCEWHCADCCDNSDEEEGLEENVDASRDGVVNRKLRQRRDSIRAKRLAAAEEEKRAYRAAILAGARSSTSPYKNTDSKKLPVKRAPLTPQSPVQSKRNRSHHINGHKANGFSSTHRTSYTTESEELGEDCFVILDDDEAEL